MNVGAQVTRTKPMVDTLQNEDSAAQVFAQAASIVDMTAPGWDRDTIRTEPVSKSIFQHFKQHYPG